MADLLLFRVQPGLQRNIFSDAGSRQVANPRKADVLRTVPT